MKQLIRAASGAPDYQSMRQLLIEYIDWMRARYQTERWLITELLDHQSLESELENLSTLYGLPNGRAFLVVQDGEVRGCGAYRTLGEGICEMKRVFIPQRFQGSGIGRQLCSTLIAAARDEGFRLMRLDTGRSMTEAITMYRTFGFQDCAPYHAYPEAMVPQLVFMELPL